MKKNIIVLSVLTFLMIGSGYMYLQLRQLEQRIKKIEQNTQMRILPAK